MLSDCGTNPKNENKETPEMSDIKPPVCELIPKELNIHNDTRIDNYFWLNDRENPKVIDYLNAENSYTKSILSTTDQLQKDLFNEMKGRIKEDDQSVPYFKNGYYYQTKYAEGGEYPIYTRAKNKDFSDVEVLIDGNEMAKDYEYFDLANLEMSPDNKMLAFATDTVSRRLYNIQFKNLETGEILSDIIPNSDGSFAWADDNQTLFYSAQDPETLRSDKILKHTLGQPSKDDELVFTETDDTFGCYVYKSKSDKYLIISSSSTLTDEFQTLEASNPNGKFKVFQPRIKGLEYSISHYEGHDQFVILTNKDGATNFKMMICEEQKTTIDNWKEFIPHRDETLIEDYSLFDNHIVLSERTAGLVHVRIINSNKGEDYYLPFNDESYVVHTSCNTEFKTNNLKYWYTSLTTHGTTYEY